MTEIYSHLTRRDIVRLAVGAAAAALSPALSFAATTDTDPIYWTIAEAARQLRARKSPPSS